MARRMLMSISVTNLECVVFLVSMIFVCAFVVIGNAFSDVSTSSFASNLVSDSRKLAFAIRS